MDRTSKNILTIYILVMVAWVVIGLRTIICNTLSIRVFTLMFIALLIEQIFKIVWYIKDVKAGKNL